MKLSFGSRLLQPVRFLSDSFSRQSRNKKVAAGVLFILLILVGGVWLAKGMNPDQEAAFERVCDDDLLNKGMQALDPTIDASNVGKLHEIAEEIQNKENFNQDPNCVFFVLQDSINSSDAEEAEKNLQALLDSYKQERLSSIVFPDHNNDNGRLKALEASVVSLVKIVEENKNQPVSSVEGEAQ